MSSTEARPTGGIFREEALRRHRAGRDAGVLPRFTSPRWLTRRRRVPVVLQMSAAECGAACLAMILGYHGRPTPLEECREHCGVSRDGLSTRTLADVARRFGLRVRGFSVEPAAFAHLDLPAIAHWNFNHFVVVERWSPERVDLVDPALGRQQVTAAEFSAAFTGVVLTFEPSATFEARGTPSAPAWRAWLGQALRVPGVRMALAQVLAASIALQVLGLGLPLLTGLVVDRLVSSAAVGLLGVLGLAAALIVATVMLTTFARARLLVYLRARLDAQLMLGFFEHLLSLPFRFFEGRKTGQLITRLGSNVVVRETLTTQTLASLLDASLVLVYLVVLLVRAPVLGLLVVGLAAVQVAAVGLASGPIHRLVARELAAQAESQGYLVEALKGILLLKSSGSEPRVLAQWANLFSTQLNVTLDRGRLAAWLEAVLGAARVGLPMLLLWAGAAWVLSGGASLGTMLGLNALAAAAMVPLVSLLATAQQLQLVGAHVQRILDVLQAEPEQRVLPARRTPPLRGAIELRNVSFRYTPTGPYVLRDVSLRVEPGQKVALVGRSGSGKSSLVLLLLGLYLPTEGDVLFDGVRLAELDLRELRAQIGVVLQDPFLFSTTVRENVAFHDPGLPLEAVVAAARTAAIEEDIAGMPLGYDTILSEGGTSLSGGQRQRLQLARAIARQPKVLLLDEATSHLDVLTERRVDDNLSRLDCTRIVVAHRLSTIHNADQILTFEQGQIVERGTHAELVARGGQYAALVQGQRR